MADLFEPERASLRQSPEHLAAVFLAVLFAYSRVSGSGDEPRLDTSELVELFLHGALTTEGKA